MAYFFNDDDIVDLKENADFSQIFSSLGISYNTKGRYIDFLCPFHNDTKFGSARADVLKKTCTCYACDESYSPIDFIMKYKNYTFFESVIELADIEGVLDSYKISSNKIINKSKYPLKKLTNDEKDLLELNTTTPNGKIIGFNYEKQNMSAYDVEANGFLLFEKINLNWNYLYENYPLEYRMVILNRVFQIKTILEKEIMNLENHLKSYNDSYKWFYICVLDIKKKRLQEVLKLGEKYGYSRVIKALSSKNKETG